MTASSSEESEQSVIPHSEGASAPETNGNTKLCDCMQLSYIYIYNYICYSLTYTAPSKDTATKQAQGRVGGEGHIPSPTPKQESSDTVGM